MDRVSDFSVFVSVVEAESMTAAANRLNMTPAAVSKRILNMENRLGVRFFDRTTRRLSVTDLGRAYAQRCRQILDEIEESEAVLARTQSEPQGILRITASTSFASGHIAPWVPRFLKLYPRLRLDLNLNDACLDLIDGGFDVAIRIGALPDSNLVARKLAPNKRVLCASPEYIASFGEPRHPDELTNHNCLVLHNAGLQEPVWQLKDNESNIHSARVSGNLICNNGNVLRDAALAGVGIAMKSTWDIYHELRAGRLQVVLPQYQLPQVDLYAVYPHRRFLSPNVKAFVDFLHRCYGPVPYWDKDVLSSLQEQVSLLPE